LNIWQRLQITQKQTILALTYTNDVENREETKGGKKESKKDGSKHFCFLSANDLTRGMVLILVALQVKSTIN